MTLLPSIKKSLYLRISWVSWNIGGSMLLNAALWALVYYSVEPKIEPVPLHISIYFGIDFTAPYWYFYFFPLGGFAVMVGHSLAARAFFRTEPFLAFTLLGMNTLVQCLALGTVAFLLYNIT
jgi:hypothetical protein